MNSRGIIQFDHVSFSYADAATAVLDDVNIALPEGDLCVVVGATGSGKSTLLQLVNGLAPHFTGGRLSGTVTVGGRDTRTHPPRALADLVGVVGQSPSAGFVTSRVDDELAYAMEQLGVPDSVMRTRVEQAIDLLGLEGLRRRALTELSGGEQQRVAIASVLTSQPRILVLDEPTSALDPTAAEEVLAAILRLVHDLGLTVLMAEHRLERVAQYADSMILLEQGRTAQWGEPTALLKHSSLAPPIVELGRSMGWSPLPLSIRDARRLAAPLRHQLRGLLPRPPVAAPVPVPRGSATVPDVALRTHRLRVHYGPVVALHGVDLTLHAGEVAAVMGRNGSGKSSLLWALQGSGVRSAGKVIVAGRTITTQRRNGSAAEPMRTEVDPTTLPPHELIRLIALVPQNPSDLLYLDSVAAECGAADRAAGSPAGTTAALLARLTRGITEFRHPRDLSEGERLALVLAIQMAGGPDILLLDEPTRGLDYDAKRRLSEVLTQLASAGTAVLLSSHDVEFVASTASRVIVLASGEVLTDGSALEVLTASPSFAPQVARIMRPLPLLTVDAVRSNLAQAQ